VKQRLSFERVWWIALAIKCLIAAVVPLSNDEAYYWVWGHHPQLSYFDHPPFVGWLFSIGTIFDFASPGLSLVRWPGVILGHATLLIWNSILRPYLTESQRKLWLIFIVVSPLIGIGSIIITPDIPLVFFWSLSLLLLINLIQTPKLSLYAGLGAALGLGFCSKYLIVIFVPIALLWLAISGEWRKVRWAYVPATIVTGLIFCAPVLIWNYQNDWASFAFQLSHGLEAEKHEWNWPLEYLGAQIALLFPPVIYFALKRKEDPRLRFLHYFGWLPLAFFFYTSFKARVEANWPIMAYPAILSLAFLNASEKSVRRIAWIWAAVMSIALSEAIFQWIPMDPTKLKTREHTRYDFVLPELTPDTYLASYQMAATISYRTQTPYYKLDGLNRRDFYDFIPQSHPTTDKFRVISERYNRLPTWTKTGYKVVNRVPLDGERYRLFEVVRDAQDADR